LPPASVAKALTSLYALDTLGADHRFQTRVMATGSVIGGVLKGDLILVGGGDHT
jgi:D-alanyl-D-alanine carboxypeptidase/D-alanyl-D-alanine-endopeptidase (penicillin-binding protein 4)